MVEKSAQRIFNFTCHTNAPDAIFTSSHSKKLPRELCQNLNLRILAPRRILPS